MTQSVDEVFSLFFDKLERDDDFFSYYGVEEEEAMQLAQERANSYLNEALFYLHTMMEFGFSFELETVKEEVEQDGETVEIEKVQFVEPINSMEANLLSEAMLLRYFENDLAKLKAKLNFLSSSDLTVLHSPANERTSFVAMLATIRENLLVLITNYQAKDRLTGKRKSVIDLSDYIDSTGAE